MKSDLKVKTALISVFYKDKIASLVDYLNANNVSIFSTGGTLDFLKQRGINATSVESLTGYPSILGGRVKTLHPKVFGGILSRDGNESDIKDLQDYEIPKFDLVVVDLYPFVETLLDKNATHSQIIEKIDIGGVSLIRAAAKNYLNIAVIPDVNLCELVLKELNSNNCSISLEVREKLVEHSFRTTAEYDVEISSYFSKSQDVRIAKVNKYSLKYGENPHQSACFYGDINDIFDFKSERLLSYNNILDIDAGLKLLNEFDEPTFIILKHNNACGVASDNDPKTAWEKALAGDPISAFGGVIITNINIDGTVASLIDKLFFEAIVSPKYTDEALTILKRKETRAILEKKSIIKNKKQYRSVLGGILEQDLDAQIGGVSEADKITVPTTKKPTNSDMSDLIFANKIVKHLKSNAIAIVKDKMLIGSGVGQTSRVDSMNIAINQANGFKHELQGAVVASDAFFPFDDCVTIAGEQKIGAIIQPGGSKRDNDSILACNKYNISMIFTNLRHFKH